MFDRFDSRDLSVSVSEMLVASADFSDLLLDGAVETVLQTLRQRLNMDVVFVSEFVDGKRIFRFVDRAADAPPLAAGQSDDLEASFCKRVVDGRLPEWIPDVGAMPPVAGVSLPFRIGTHISTPVVLNDGSVFGTLCCFSNAPNPEVQDRDLVTLRQCAKLVARKLDIAGSRGFKELGPAWTRSPSANYSSDVWNLNGPWAAAVADQSRAGKR